MNAATKPSTSVCPRSDRPASCSPAAQPSVRAASAAPGRQRRAGPRSAGHGRDLLQQRRRFLGREPQLSGAQLGQLPAGPQPRQGQWRVAAAGQRQMQPRRPVLEQEPNRLMHSLRADHVIIIRTSSSASSAPGWPSSSLIKAITSGTNDRGGGDPSSGPIRSLIPGRARSSAATVCRQNLAGSLSPASSDATPPDADHAGPTRPKRQSCRTRPARKPRPVLVPGPPPAVAPVAGAAPDLVAAQARSAWWPAGHRAPTLRPRLRPTHPSVTCTIGASGDLASLPEPIVVVSRPP